MSEATQVLGTEQRKSREARKPIDNIHKHSKKGITVSTTVVSGSHPRRSPSVASSGFSPLRLICSVDSGAGKKRNTIYFNVVVGSLG